MNPLNLYATIQFVRRLATPFNQWPAFKEGIIDDKGEPLKKFQDLNTVAERNAWTRHDLLVSKIKRLLEKVPGGRSRLASYAAAIWLIKEEQWYESEDLTQVELLWSDDGVLEEIEEIKQLLEDAPVNSVGGGSIAGTPAANDDPPINTALQQAIRQRNKRRKGKTLDAIDPSKLTQRQARVL